MECTESQEEVTPRDDGQAERHFREITLKENGPSQFTCCVKSKANFKSSTEFDYLLRFRDVSALNSPEGIEILDEIIRVAIGFVDKVVLPSALNEICNGRTLLEQKAKLCRVNEERERENNASDSVVKSREVYEAGFVWETSPDATSGVNGFVDEDEDSYVESKEWVAENDEVESCEDPDDAENINEDLDRAVSELNDIQVCEPDDFEQDDEAPLISTKLSEHKPSLKLTGKFHSLDEFSLKFTRNLLNDWKNPLKRVFTRIKSEEFHLKHPACDESSALIGRNRSCQSVFDRIRSDNDSENRSENFEEERLAQTLGKSSEPLSDWQLNPKDFPIQNNSNCKSATIVRDALKQRPQFKGDVVKNNSHSSRTEHFVCSSFENRCQSSTLNQNCDLYPSDCAHQDLNEDSLATRHCTSGRDATMSGKPSNGSISGVAASQPAELNGSAPSGVR